jgi:hypothetical protein
MPMKYNIINMQEYDFFKDIIEDPPTNYEWYDTIEDPGLLMCPWL